MKTLAAVLLFATGASAQANLANPHQGERKTIIVFEAGGDIIADPLPAMISQIQTGPTATFSPLIRVRENFNDKVMQSVNDL